MILTFIFLLSLLIIENVQKTMLKKYQTKMISPKYGRQIMVNWKTLKYMFQLSIIFLFKQDPQAF
jgi:hypothetical protein